MSINVKGTFIAKEQAELRNGQIAIDSTSDALIWKINDVAYECVTTASDVESVNGKTGVVVLDADDISDSGTTNKYTNTTDITKLGHISVTQAVDLDTIESDTATNNAKVSNATHTGDATGSTALTVEGIRNIKVESTIPTDGDIQGTVLQGQWYENLLRWSEDISQTSVWLNQGVGSSPTDFVAPSGAGQYQLRQLFGVVGSDATFRFKATVGNAPFLLAQVFNPTTGSKFFYVNTATGAITNASVGVTGEASVNGSVLTCALSVDTQNGSTYCYIYPSDVAGVLSFSGGDGSTVTYSIIETQVLLGDLDKTRQIPYTKTTTTTETGTQKFKVVDAGATASYTTITAIEVNNGIITSISGS
jgi:hypothetical protein